MEKGPTEKADPFYQFNCKTFILLEIWWELSPCGDYRISS
jgi:hypothetical protein